MLWPLTGIDLDNTVFVAFTGEELHINCRLNIPANQTSDILTCFDPFHKQIYNCNVPETNEKININISLKLKRLKSSGEYACRYKTAEVFWFLHVRGEFGWQNTINIIVHRLETRHWSYVVKKYLNVKLFNQKWNIICALCFLFVYFLFFGNGSLIQLIVRTS